MPADISNILPALLSTENLLDGMMGGFDPPRKGRRRREGEAREG